MTHIMINSHLMNDYYFDCIRIEYYAGEFKRVYKHKTKGHEVSSNMGAFGCPKYILYGKEITDATERFLFLNLFSLLARCPNPNSIIPNYNAELLVDNMSVARMSYILIGNDCKIIICHDDVNPKKWRMAYVDSSNDSSGVWLGKFPTEIVKLTLLGINQTNYAIL